MLQQLLRLGALSDVPDDLQWTARMLLPKSVACAPTAAEPRSPPQRPAPAAPPAAAWAPDPPAPVGPAQHDAASPTAAVADLMARTRASAPIALSAAATAVQPRPPSAGPLPCEATQQLPTVKLTSAVVLFTES